MVEEQINELIIQMENRGWEFYRDDSRRGVFFRKMKKAMKPDEVFEEKNLHTWDNVEKFVEETEPIEF